MAISRIDYKNTHGWSVRVSRGSREHGTWKEINALFSDKKCGGRDRAYEMALQREKEIRQGNPEMERAPFREFAQKNSRTRVSGVCRTFKRSRHHPEVKFPGYSVLYRKTGGTRASKFFGDATWGGQAEAFAAAKAFRNEWEKRVTQKTIPQGEVDE